MSEPEYLGAGRVTWRDRAAALIACASPVAMGQRDQIAAPAGGSAARGLALADGHVALAGADITLRDGSIWQPAAPFPAFEVARQSFVWLDDLAAQGTRSARVTAQVWVGAWLARHGKGTGPGWTMPVAARRLRRLAQHAAWLSIGEAGLRPARLDRAFGRHCRFLARRLNVIPPGPVGLETCCDIIMVAAALDGADRVLEGALARLDPACRALVGEGGGVADRSPETLARIFSALAFASAGLRAAGRSPSEAHAAALGRAAPVLRALRHTDGAMARFHGGGGGDVGRIDAALAASGLRAEAMPRQPMGFARLARGRTSLITDIAVPPSAGWATGLAHAATLAFELTSARRPLIVNRGPGAAFGPDWHAAARQAESQSTLVIDSDAADGPRPGTVEADLYLDLPNAHVVAAHNGYSGSHGLIHVRRLDLDLTGGVLAGEDLLSAVTEAEKRRFAQMRSAAMADPETGLRGVPFAIRFHLHPDVDAALDNDLGEIILAAPGGQRWSFRHDGSCAIGLDPSVYLENSRATPVATRQIVLRGRAAHAATSVRWSFMRDPELAPFQRDVPADDSVTGDVATEPASAEPAPAERPPETLVAAREADLAMVLMQDAATAPRRRDGILPDDRAVNASARTGSDTDGAGDDDPS